MQTLRHLIEYALLEILFTAFKTLPLDVASLIGGFMARAVGPFLSAHRTASANLSMVFPNMSDFERRGILMDMWDNLGRVSAELAHLPNPRLHARVHIKDERNIPKPGTPVLFFSGHLGNWELTYPMAQHHGLPVTVIYREANNPYVDKLVADLRATQSTGMIPKGPKGVARLVRAIKDGQTLAMLVDQKMNDGIAVPFFGREAMTAPAIAELALRYDTPLVPVRVIRTKGCHFEAEVLPPLSYLKTGDTEKDVLTIMTQINALLEKWIRQHPAQWFWVHKRWPK